MNKDLSQKLANIYGVDVSGYQELLSSLRFANDVLDNTGLSFSDIAPSVLGAIDKKVVKNVDIKCCAISNIKELFNSEGFGSKLGETSQRTSKIFQGQTVYEAKSDMKEYKIKRGDQFYLDGLHKDHIEVFDKRGNFKFVLNLDGALNQKKTEAAEGRRLK